MTVIQGSHNLDAIQPSTPFKLYPEFNTHMHLGYVIVTQIGISIQFTHKPLSLLC